MTRRRHTEARAAGFTLIEVMVAFAVLGLMLAALLQVFSGGLNQYRVASAYATAAGLAESKLAELGASEPVAAGDSEGRFDDDFRWRMAVAPYDEATAAAAGDDGLRLYHVTLTVAWGAAANERTVALETLRLGQAE